MSAALQAQRPLPLGGLVVTPSFSTLAFAALVALLTFAHLDGLANRLSEALPLSLYGAIYGAAGLLAACAWLEERRTRLTGIPAHGARLAIAFFLWAVFAWTLSVHGEAGKEYLIGLAKSVGLLLLVALLVDRVERLNLALWAVAGSGLFSALIVYGDFVTGQRLISTSDAAVLAEFGGFARSAGASDENPTTAAHMLLASTAVLVGFLAAGKGRRLLLAGALLVCAGALMLMSARSALIGLAAVFGLLLLILRNPRAFAAMGVLGIVVVAVAVAVAPPATFERILAVANWTEDPTLFRRATYLVIGGDLFASSPIWGIGPGNYPWYFMEDSYRFLPGRGTDGGRELHNTYLDVAVELGAVGLALFAALAVAAFSGLRRAARIPALSAPALALMLALAGLLVASFFMPNKDMRYLWILLGLALQCGRMARQREAAP